ncbi:Rmf/CrpP fold protein [Streptomyces sp. NPDC004296]|uniref:Rmf/CrpP fold protein n=1 Tax=Streptomyces sp. NPDC004296 TaxID=3364697 RepID=UPI00367A5F2D
MGTRGDLVRAITAGAAAGRSGDPVTTCPYPSGDLRRSAWVRGYAKTARLLPDDQHDQEQAAE